jgi:hypothetical protein
MCLMNSAPLADTAMPARDARKRLVLFYRDFQAFSGGHLKVWDYFNHVLSSATHEPLIAFSEESKWDATNPWLKFRNYTANWQPDHADILFLAGTDWRALSKRDRRNFSKPIINLIQHPRHAEPREELHDFLSNRAIRICVSQQVADAIESTGKVNGPMLVIANGIDLAEIPGAKPYHQRALDVLICGNKAPDLAAEVQKAISVKVNVASLVDWIPRPEYLARLNEAKVAVMLPRPLEGFYLPALEAMACGAVVVCPDCVGNRDFCRSGVNCYRPAYAADEIIATMLEAVRLTGDERTNILNNARLTVGEHSLENERTSFLRILERVDELWNRNR